MTAISVIVGTFGDESWKEQAQRAIASAEHQSVEPLDVIHIHERTLHAARNAGAVDARGEYLVFLDADDELDYRYIEAMTARIEALSLGEYLYQPATLGIVNGKEDPEPVMIPQRPLDTGNFMVIGTAVSKDLFTKVGGFLDWPIYEDWCLWIRCHKAGASFAQVPDAIYRVHVKPQSRNQADRKTQVRYFNEIRKRYYR